MYLNAISVLELDSSSKVSLAELIRNFAFSSSVFKLASSLSVQETINENASDALDEDFLPWLECCINSCAQVDANFNVYFFSSKSFLKSPSFFILYGESNCTSRFVSAYWTPT